MARDEELLAHPLPILIGGRYVHYKGGVYVVVALANTHHHNGDKDVVYLSLKTGQYNTRPFLRDSRDEDSWNDIVKWPDGRKRWRFVQHRLLADAAEGLIQTGKFEWPSFRMDAA